MSRIGRLAGAILAETEGSFFLIGNTKEPCDFAARGFEPPDGIDALARPFIRLSPARPTSVEAPCLSTPLEGEALARLLAHRFLIERNGSVSERLWGLVADSEGSEKSASGEIDARWLVEMPARVWEIVRDVVLRCL